MTSKLALSIWSVSIFSMLWATVASAQTTHNVTLEGALFIQADLTIAVGDTVHWQWVSGNHNVVSGVGGVHDGNFNSGDPVFPGDPPTTFDVVFDQAFLDAHPKPDNIYPYYCIVHLIQGMTGTVTVQKGPPTGACCDPVDAGCEEAVLEAECPFPLKWTEDSSCAEAGCEVQIPIVSGPGMIVLTVLLLAAAWVVLARRRALLEMRQVGSQRAIWRAPK